MFLSFGIFLDALLSLLYEQQFLADPVNKRRESGKQSLKSPVTYYLVQQAEIVRNQAKGRRWATHAQSFIRNLGGNAALIVEEGWYQGHLCRDQGEFRTKLEDLCDHKIK